MKPSGSVKEPVSLDRAGELSRNGGGTFAVIDEAPRDKAAAATIHDDFAEARIDEWAEFLADCGKFDDEIVREIENRKFTFGELEGVPGPEEARRTRASRS